MKKYSIQLISLTLILTLASCQADSNGNDPDNAAIKKSGETTSTEKGNTDVKASNGTRNSQDSGEPSGSNDPKDQKEGQLNDPKTSNPDTGEEPLVLEEIAPIEVIEVENGQTEIDAYDFHAYKKLDALLSKYVTYSGHVNYASIKSNKSELNAIIKEFESNYPDGDFSYTQKLSYWINAYNVYTINLIVDNYPTTSITKITAKPWDKKFIKLGGTTYSLNNLENDIIRKNYNEPRIHFALNCASKSCPVLLNKAYKPAKLYGQLNSQTKRFLTDTSKNQFSDKSIKISKIFDWYGDDFKKNGTLIDFFNKYRTEQLSSPKISYMDYSWDLNK